MGPNTSSRHLSNAHPIDPRQDTETPVETVVELEGSGPPQTSTREPNDLVEALMDLHCVRSVAEEEGCELPPEDMVAVGERVLRSMYRWAPRWYGVYPMLDGEIVIDAPTVAGTKVIVILHKDGTLQCSTLIDDRHDHRVYSDPSEIPDDFILSALSRTRTHSPTATMQVQEQE